MRARTVAALGVAGALMVGAAGTAISDEVFESPAEGQQFQYFGPARDASDPDQPESMDNDVARFDTTTGAPVGMTRKVDERVFELDNQLGFKYFMANRNCGAGSPRIQLAVDEDGDGTADGNLHGHVEPPTFACATGKWVYQDLTDDLLRWEIGAGLSGSGGFPYKSWSQVEAVLGSAMVVRGSLIEDSQAFKVDNRGIAYYDLVSIGNRTFEDHNDTADTGTP